MCFDLCTLELGVVQKKEAGGGYVAVGRNGEMNHPRGLQIVGEMSIVAGPFDVTTRVVKFSAETHTYNSPPVTFTISQWSCQLAFALWFSRRNIHVGLVECQILYALSIQVINSS